MVDRDEHIRFESERALMVRYQLQGRGIRDNRVLDVMGQIPREEFVGLAYQEAAYADSPLPIGLGQTISQPYMVALMTELLDVDASMEVLEIGTGCGYQSSVLAKLAKRVYTVERLAQLQETAQSNLARLGIDNIEFYIGDGSRGWPTQRTFDRIIVTAGAEMIPPALIRQLAQGGKMVIPVGAGYSQVLTLCVKNRGELRKIEVCDCVFVRLIAEDE